MIRTPQIRQSLFREDFITWHSASYMRGGQIISVELFSARTLNFRWVRQTSSYSPSEKLLKSTTKGRPSGHLMKHADQQSVENNRSILVLSYAYNKQFCTTRAFESQVFMHERYWQSNSTCSHSCQGFLTYPIVSKLNLASTINPETHWNEFD